jgi:hypothetical protein
MTTLPVLWVLVFGGALPPTLLGQFKIRVDLVSVNVSVLGPEQSGVRDLSLDDFVLLEDGIPQRIIGFEEASQPSQLVLIIDSSNSESLTQELGATYAPKYYSRSMSASADFRRIDIQMRSLRLRAHARPGYFARQESVPE